MFRKVLVANRGEIAARILTVLRERGISTVAVYSEADAGARHVALADEALCVGPPPVAQSYLNQDAVLDAARRTGAEALHPGYGLLSENPGFARRCAEAGVVFVGPTPEAIEAMGDKARARATAAAAGVPVVPGSGGPVTDEEAPTLADRIGYPVLIKASGGGGGIGMTVVEQPAKLARGLRSCRDRATASFGNPAVYLERYVERPRHIEVQVLFDHHGHGVHLFERECTLQRRHQKVVEEAPSPFVSGRPGLREGLCDAALRAARAIGYRNAGTLEFVVSPEGEYFFIEMNTRLQVEHPVTEAITGVDLIGWQLDIAAGAPLTLKQEDLRIGGHAIEVRVCAEDPAKKFFPQPGPVDRVVVPEGPGVRFDAGLVAGQPVTPYYDSLVGKLSAHGAHREEASARLRSALAHLIIEPLVTNRVFLEALVSDPAFAAADYHTTWLEGFAERWRAAST